ncbi:MAG TPA: iron-sulfur cluster repair di-iron protein [Flavobacteriaceae bacterium]|nr:iron-sulfur cluster repair di-iron protein [Flavobacteriaceae bacterium]
MKISDETIIGQLVAENYAFASIFEKHNIDFYIHGTRSIATAAKESSIDSKQLVAELEALEQKSIHSEEDYNNWPLDQLADYIQNTHHRFTEAKITELKPLLVALVDKHSDTNPEVIELQKVFEISAGDMASHMKKEELVLFPFIRKMIKTKKSHDQISVPHFGTVQNPVNMMLHEHDEQSKLLRKMIELTNNFTLPKDACDTFKTAYASLKAFDTDMHKHIHLENNILFPKAVALEKTLKKP